MNPDETKEEMSPPPKKKQTYVVMSRIISIIINCFVQECVQAKS